jgi:hypothetical protein
MWFTSIENYTSVLNPPAKKKIISNLYSLLPSSQKTKTTPYKSPLSFQTPFPLPIVPLKKLHVVIPPEISNTQTSHMSTIHDSTLPTAGYR